MRHAVMALLLLVACERDRGAAPAPPPAPRPVPPPPVRPVEFPGCTARYPLPEQPPTGRGLDYIAPRPGESVASAFRRWDAHEGELSKLALDDLLRIATPAEAAAVLRDRILELGDRAFDQLAPPERHVFAVDVLSAEVSNGGLDQFFFNSSGDLALEARDGLAAIGPAPLLGVYECALAAFPDGKPSRDRETRMQQLDGIRAAHPDAFDVLDRSFYAYRDRDDAILEYVHSHLRELPNAANPTSAR
jgi:hypothetical protein